VKISAKTKLKPTPVSVDYDIPENLAGLTSKFGQDVVAAHANGSIVISLQAFMRRHIEKSDFSLQKLQDAVKVWKPDVRSVVRMSAFDRAAGSIDKLSPQERAELLKRLQAPQAAQAVKTGTK
jgi:hypothetical protein